MKKKSSDLIKNIKVVLTGTSLSQIIPLVFYPLLTRIYSPEQFGFMAFFMSVCSILIVISSGAYEQAILITKNNSELESLIKLIIVRSFIILIVISSTIFLLINTLPYLFDYRSYNNWILTLTLTVFLSIIFNVYNEWCVKKVEFKKLSYNKVYNSFFVSLFKSLNSFISLIPNGLIYGELIGKFIVALLSFKSMLSAGTKIFKAYNLKILNIVSRKFKDYPRYMMPDMLLNTLGGSVHVYIILAFFDPNELGYISLSLSLLTLPVTVISGGIKDVFREKANNLYINDGSCRKFYLQLMKPISIIGFLGFILLYFIAPIIFPLILGDQWLKSGIYAQYLIPFFYFNFVSMSLGGVFIIANKIKISLYWQIFNASLTVAALLIGSLYYGSIPITLIFYTIAKSTSYILYIILSYKYSVNPNHVKL